MLGESRRTALTRFVRNEKSLLRKGNWEKFQQVVQEYISMGHAQLATPQELCLPDQFCYYMPMHAVFKSSSSSTKIRVVFDASCPTSSGVSLNDILEAGPTLHPNLDIILVRFRSYRVALSGDVSKMYREVLLSEADRQYHRFVWRPQLVQPCRDYVMNRVTFGVTSSPFVAVQTLQQTALDHSSPQEIASWHVHNSMYVDDLLAGAGSVEEAIELYKDMRKLLLKGGLELKKWRSSSSRVLAEIPTDLQELLPNQEFVDNHSHNYPKALGITWDSRKDKMAAQVQLPQEFTSSKRGIVSDTAKSFDILGWMSPFIIRMKILFQKLWKEKVGWDDELEESLAAQYIQWRAELSILKDISLPRCYFDSEPTTSITLHGFSDTSTLAYAATIYIRATYSDGSVSSKLVMAKTRVAPLKTVSVPRLELCGAMMLSELLATVQVILDLPKSAVFAWIDSTVALSWLRGYPSTYKTFVANRVSTAARNVEQSAWKYVPTNENPADCASRGVSALELKEHPLWWEGPSWLKSDPVTIPTQPGELDQGRADEEKKSVTVHNSAAAPTECWEAKFNDYSRLVGCTAYMLRFSSNLKAKLQGDPLPKELRLTVDERGAAEEVLFQRAQSRHYGKEFRKLSAVSPSPLVKGSRLRMVNPFVEEKGLLQVRGRLQRSDLTTLQKQPIILPSSDPVTRMFFKEIHVSLLHCGPTILLANTGLRVYVPGTKRLARSVCQNCLVCKKAAPRTLTQRMGQLPPPRIKKTLCFIHTGVDYAGPFLLKRGNPRKPTVVKGYLAVFICLATKAVHLEVVSALSTEAFLAALRRFIGRRNLPKHLYSDHGSNFLGARNQLKYLMKYCITTLSTIHAMLSTSIEKKNPQGWGLLRSSRRQLCLPVLCCGIQ